MTCLTVALLSLPSKAVVTSSHWCFAETGFDYVGNDIGNASSPSVDGCCEKCEALPGCKAYSWSSYDNGRCWFKSGRGTIVANAEVKSASLQPIGGGGAGGCQLDEGIDYIGNDIGMLKPLSCCSACGNFPGCRAFTFTTFNGGTCWLKSKKGPMVVNPEARSAEPYEEAPTCGLEYGIDYIGNDIGNVQASNAGDCCDKCSKWEGCRAFSWSMGMCYLKNRKDVVVAKEGVISAQTEANPAAPSCALELDVDYLGDGIDIGNAPSTGPYACCSKCMAKSGCKAFSWSAHDKGTCWFKSSKGTPTSKPGVKSAVV